MAADHLWSYTTRVGPEVFRWLVKFRLGRQVGTNRVDVMVTVGYGLVRNLSVTIRPASIFEVLFQSHFF